jgi:hypothetical protein
MPTAVENALMTAAGKLAASGRLKNGRKYKNLADAKKGFVYGTMTNMAKRGKIKWPGHGGQPNRVRV